MQTHSTRHSANLDQARTPTIFEHERRHPVQFVFEYRNDERVAVAEVAVERTTAQLRLGQHGLQWCAITVTREDGRGSLDQFDAMSAGVTAHPIALKP